MSTLMTERRRPLENDDGQGALFGGEALRPGRPSARRGSARRDERRRAPSAAPFEASVDADAGRAARVGRAGVAGEPLERATPAAPSRAGPTRPPQRVGP